MGKISQDLLKKVMLSHLSCAGPHQCRMWRNVLGNAKMMTNNNNIGHEKDDEKMSDLVSENDDEDEEKNHLPSVSNANKPPARISVTGFSP